MTDIACVVIGAGGHARVILDCLRSMPHVTARAIVDTNPDRWKRDCDGVPIVGDDRELVRLSQAGVTHFVVGIGSIVPGAARLEAFQRALQAGLTPLTVVHASAVCSPSASLGVGAMIFPGAIVNAGARIGANVIVNTRVVVEHDCAIGDHAHVAPGAVLAGSVRVGEHTHVGAGAIVRQGICVGARALIGAGAVVVRDVSDGKSVRGVPAREYP